jgi:hypothetical protein
MVWPCHRSGPDPKQNKSALSDAAQRADGRLTSPFQTFEIVQMFDLPHLSAGVHPKLRPVACSNLFKA